MFSRAEIEFLKGEKECNPNYARFLRHSIAKKLRHLEREVLPILLANENTRAWIMEAVRKFPNVVGENSNTEQIENTLNLSYFSKMGLDQEVLWRARRELNPRPSGLFRGVKASPRAFLLLSDALPG